jgi:hypothetical protein
MKKRSPRTAAGWKPNLATCWVTWVSVGFGIDIWCLFDKGRPAPVGLVWGIAHGGKKQSFHVYGSYVHEWARRQGVRTRINQAIFEHYDVIVTGGGSKDGGEAFLKAAGYKSHPATGQWFLERPKKDIPARRSPRSLR